MNPGDVIAGKYELKTLLGKGGFGTVWRAHHRDLGKDVALKVLNAEVANNEDAQQRFLREVEATTSFVHKHAVQLRDFGQDRERNLLYFTMDVVEGPTLEEVLRAEGTLEPERAVRLGCQLLDALAEAHDAGLVHRDLKPSNLILTEGRRGEEVRVLDFGIAKAVSQAGENTKGLTLAGMTIGTLSYMSPEQAQGKTLDGRSDLYSLAVVLYEALTGRLPIEPEPDAEDPQKNLVFRIVVAEPTRPTDPLPRDLIEVLMQALSKSASDRPADARAMRAALESADLSPPPEDTVTFEVTRGAPLVSPPNPTASFEATMQTPAPTTAHTTAQIEAGPGTRRGSSLTVVLASMAVSLVLLLGALAVAVGFDVGGIKTNLLATLQADPTPAATGKAKTTAKTKTKTTAKTKTKATPKTKTKTETKTAKTKPKTTRRPPAEKTPLPPRKTAEAKPTPKTSTLAAAEAALRRALSLGDAGARQRAIKAHVRSHPDHTRAQEILDALCGTCTALPGRCVACKGSGKATLPCKDCRGNPGWCASCAGTGKPCRAHGCREGACDGCSAARPGHCRACARKPGKCAAPSCFAGRCGHCKSFPKWCPKCKGRTARKAERVGCTQCRVETKKGAKCARCGGGKLTRLWHTKPNGFLYADWVKLMCGSCVGRCKICRGAAQCGACKGTAKCTACRGSTKCVTCGGAGKCQACKGTNHCRRCQGNKVCRPCGGTTRVVSAALCRSCRQGACPTCAGFGFTKGREPAGSRRR